MHDRALVDKQIRTLGICLNKPGATLYTRAANWKVISGFVRSLFFIIALKGMIFWQLCFLIGHYRCLLTWLLKQTSVIYSSKEILRNNNRFSKLHMTGKRPMNYFWILKTKCRASLTRLVSNSNVYIASIYSISGQMVRHNTLAASFELSSNLKQQEKRFVSVGPLSTLPFGVELSCDLSS